MPLINLGIVVSVGCILTILNIGTNGITRKGDRQKRLYTFETQETTTAIVAKKKSRNQKSVDQNYFERVVLINLKRRPDRLKEAQEELLNWCFKEPILFEAIDGNKVPVPFGWQEGGGAWGCMQSHRHILEKAIMDKVESVMVLEDDFVLCENFKAKVLAFLEQVPDDWDQLMLGGQHLSNPRGVKPGVIRCTNCQRTHAYAIRGRFLRELYSHWHSPNSKVHCDWIMGPLQESFKVYAPDPFLIGQRTSDSDISGRKNPTKFWIPPTGKETVVLLKCPKEILGELRNNGVHFGYERNKEDIDVGLVDAYAKESPNINRLSEWLHEIMWEVRSDENLIVAACWHPKANIEHLKSIWSGPVFEISGYSTEEIIKKIELRMKNTGRLFL